VFAKQCRYGKNKGFTLIELLVVISIIALLLSILMPSLARVKEQAKKVVCSAGLHQQALSFATYSSDNNSKYPPGVNWGHFPFAGLINSTPTPNMGYDTGNSSTWEYSGQASLLVGGYLDDGIYFFCPAARRSHQFTYEWLLEIALAGVSSFDFTKMTSEVFDYIATGYPYWVGYRDDPALFGSKRANRVASNANDRSDKVIVTDVITTNTEGPDCVSDPGYIADWEVQAVNHLDGDKVAGGNLLRNGGDVTWERFGDMFDEGLDTDGHYKRMMSENPYWGGVLFSWF